jgi:hypothetical protein
MPGEISAYTNASIRLDGLGHIPHSKAISIAHKDYWTSQFDHIVIDSENALCLSPRAVPMRLGASRSGTDFTGISGTTGT